jgi:transcriptional regulator with GAF, ATPase, and Fis domain
VLESHKVKPLGGVRYRKLDVRLVAASNRDLTGEVKRGHFRQDR